MLIKTKIRFKVIEPIPYKYSDDNHIEYYDEMRSLIESGYMGYNCDPKWEEGIFDFIDEFLEYESDKITFKDMSILSDLYQANSSHYSHLFFDDTLEDRASYGGASQVSMAYWGEKIRNRAVKLNEQSKAADYLTMDIFKEMYTEDYTLEDSLIDRFDNPQYDFEVDLSKNIRTDILNLPIETMDLSVSTYRKLKMNEVNSISQLIDKISDDFAKKYDLTETEYREMMNKLHGYKLLFKPKTEYIDACDLEFNSLAQFREDKGAILMEIVKLNQLVKEQSEYKYDNLVGHDVYINEVIEITRRLYDFIQITGETSLYKICKKVHTGELEFYPGYTDEVVHDIENMAKSLPLFVR